LPGVDCDDAVARSEGMGGILGRHTGLVETVMTGPSQEGWDIYGVMLESLRNKFRHFLSRRCFGCLRLGVSVGEERKMRIRE
jgi:hypothetical protein